MENKRRRLNEDDIKLLEQDLEELLTEEQDGVSSMINGLPSDLWLDILRRIPAAHLFPLKSVCKTFHRLISNDFFVRLPHHLNKDLFTNKPTTSSACFIISTDSKVPTLTYDPEKKSSRFDYYVIDDPPIFDYYCGSSSSSYHVIDDPPIPLFLRHRPRFIESYHGLLLVRIFDRLLLCNPITRSYIQFLPSICGFSQEDFGCWKIAYDDVSEKYKVFGLGVQRNKVSLYVFDVEDGRSHLPREITMTTADVGSDQIIVDDVIKESVLVNGNVCWLIITKESEKETEWHTSIVSASVTTEVVKTRYCFDQSFLDVDSDTLFAANGTFYIGKGTHAVTYLNLWILEGFESGNRNPTWRMKHLIEIGPPITRILSIMSVHIRPLGLFRDKVLFMIMQSYRCYELCMYDVVSGDFDKVKLPREEEFDVVTWGIYVKRERRSFGPFRIVEHFDIV